MRAARQVVTTLPTLTRGSDRKERAVHYAYCGYCGKRLEDCRCGRYGEKRFCESCGHRLSYGECNNVHCPARYER